MRCSASIASCLQQALCHFDSLHSKRINHLPASESNLMINLIRSHITKALIVALLAALSVSFYQRQRIKTLKASHQQTKSALAACELTKQRAQKASSAFVFGFDTILERVRDYENQRNSSSATTISVRNPFAPKS